MDKYIGRLLDDRYEILEVIGVGGMAVVYKAKCHRLNRMVAIKILKDDYLEDEDFRSRFHAEGRAVAMLSHPNIVSVYDVSTTSGGDYIVMELIEGITLKQYIERKGALSWKETLHFALQIAKALDHAHSRGIVHRDIKPHNIMVLRNGTVKVADFGIARGIAKGNTLRKEALGSVHYISPEQAKGEHVDARSDLYSLGVVMYEMATAKQPYEGTSPINVALQHINGTAVMPSVLNTEIPVGLEQIIMKALEKEPEARYDSAVAMAEAIEQLQNDPETVFPYPMLEISTRRTSSEEGPKVVRMQQKNKPAEKTPVKLPEDKRRKTAQNDKSGKNTNVARVAIIACTAAILIAIGILVLLLSGNLFGSGEKMVSVPDLNGKMFATLPSYPGVKIEKGTEVYDNFYLLAGEQGVVHIVAHIRPRRVGNLGGQTCVFHTLCHFPHGECGEIRRRTARHNRLIGGEVSRIVGDFPVAKVDANHLGRNRRPAARLPHGNYHVGRNLVRHTQQLIRRHAKHHGQAYLGQSVATNLIGQKLHRLPRWVYSFVIKRLKAANQQFFHFNYLLNQR